MGAFKARYKANRLQKHIPDIKAPLPTTHLSPTRSSFAPAGFFFPLLNKIRKTSHQTVSKSSTNHEFNQELMEDGEAVGSLEPCS